jgi:NodT family efflux transporter outer membrane factor (OMF) lipoprotein
VAGGPGEPSAARIEWRDFFSDPHLLELIDTALANNKEVGIMMQRLSAAQYEVQARRGEYLPFVSLGAEAGAGRVGEHTREGAVEDGLTLPGMKPFPTLLGEFRFGLSSTWEIDAWKKLRNAKKAAVLEYMATAEGRNLLVTSLVAEVARAYYELMALDNQLENLEQYLAIQRDGLKMVRQLQAYARSNALAVNRYQAEVAKNLALEFAIAQQITVVENELNLLLGRTPRPIARASQAFLDFQPRTLVTGVPSELLQNRPDLRKAELELQAAELDIKVARASFYPKLELRAGLGFEASSLQHLFTTPASVAASLLGGLVAPLVNKRALIARSRTANARQIQAALEYEQRILSAFTEVANQLSQIDNLGKSLRYKQEQVALLTESVEVASNLFRSARAEYLEVLLTQREALEARRELIETKEKQILAMVVLYRALGGGWRDMQREPAEPAGA